MRRALAVLSVTAAMAVSVTGSLAPAVASPPVQPAAEITLRTAAGATTGTVVITDQAGQSHVRVRATGLTPGFHGFHVHAVGQCDGSTSTPFSSAGGHWNPDSSTHGNHDGDMPPLYADASGVVAVDFVTDAFRVAALRDADGAAVVVHAGPDNLAHIPTRYTFTNADGTTGTGPDTATKATGDAGARFACGVVPADQNGFGHAVEPTRTRSTRADLRTAAGAAAGVVKLTPAAGDRVHISVDATSLTPGFHGFHVHAVGQCDGSTTPPFTSAGGHLSSGGAEHGHHAGDLPPLFATADGRARAEFDVDRPAVAQVLDADGGAIVVHAAPDNLAHIPTRYAHTNPDGTTGTGPDAASKATGDAGARVLCGVVVAPTAPAAISLAVDAPVITAGNSPQLRGRVSDSAGGGASDVEVTVFAKPYGATSYQPVAAVLSDSSGAFELVVRPTTQTAYVARVDSLTSGPVVVSVHARVIVTAPAAGSTVGSPSTFSGRLVPAYGGQPVGLATYAGSGPNRRWVYLAQVTTAADGSFTLTRALPRGTAPYVLYTPARSGTRRGSASVTVTVG
ncbi:MAG TPA: superoxide dismutase family protein [Mycobacteriales bacterium]|nr:superoxide dismutase family protein [Mycobacteriales bacterium]